MLFEITASIIIAALFFWGYHRYEKWYEANKHKKNFNPHDRPFGGN